MGEKRGGEGRQGKRSNRERQGISRSSLVDHLLPLHVSVHKPPSQVDPSWFYLTLHPTFQANCPTSPTFSSHPPHLVHLRPIPSHLMSSYKLERSDTDYSTAKGYHQPPKKTATWKSSVADAHARTVEGLGDRFVSLLDDFYRHSHIAH